MTLFQKIVKYCAMAFAFYLVILIVGGLLAGLGGLSFLSDRFGDIAESDETKIYPLAQDISGIEIETGAADCEIVTGEKFQIESNSSRLDINDKNGRLVITDGTRRSVVPVKIKLYIPSDARINGIELTAGAGKIYAESLVCSSLSLECGAGDVEIAEAVAAVKTEIEGGVGKITIGSGTLTNLDLDMGVGSLDLTGRLLGECDLELGIGDADITLVGSAEDYSINYDSYGDSGKTAVNIEKGIGTVNIDYTQAG